MREEEEGCYKKIWGVNDSDNLNTNAKAPHLKKNFLIIKDLKRRGRVCKW